MMLKITMFLTLCIEKTTIRAAHKLHVTQPAISQGIKELEQQLNVQLFRREGRNLVLTREGEAFIPYAQQYQRAHESALHAFSKKNNKITIGSSLTIASYYLPQIVERFEKKYQIETTIVANNVRTVTDLLQTQQVDIALLEGNYLDDSFMHFPIGHFALYFVATPAYLKEIAKNKQPYTFVARESGSSYRIKLENYCSVHNFPLNIKWSCATNESVLQATLQNQGVALLPKEMIESAVDTQQLIQLDFEGMPEIETFYLAGHRLRMNDPSIQQFLQEMFIS